MATVRRDALVGSWTHSHEDDTAGTRVYRPASHPFPPSRGRDSFELAADGTLLERGIGAADRPATSRGTWELTGADELILRSGARSDPRRLRVVSVAGDRLVVAR